MTKTKTQMTLFGSLLLLVVGIVRPVACAYRALEHGKPHDVHRWLLFFACSMVSVFPVMAWLPAWVPFRYEFSVLVLTVLGMSDARVAEAVYQRYVRDKLSDLFGPMMSHSSEDVHGVLTALETAGSNLRTRAMPSPVPKEEEISDGSVIADE